MSKNINENDMGDRMNTGISYGTSGIVNPGVSTFSSPEASQHPINFYPVGANTVDQYSITRTTGPDDVDINAIKGKVTPDEVLTGLDYELKKMTYKNKAHAKELVVANLKKNPKFYSSLQMMGMSDELMNENVEQEAAKIKKEAFDNIFKEMMERKKLIQNRHVDDKITAAYTDSILKFKNSHPYST